jgi:hypothetical protein
VVGWRRLRPWGLGMAACAVVLAGRRSWVGAAFVGLLWLGYVLFVRAGRCGVGQGCGPCDEPVSGLLGTCHRHRGDKSRHRPRIVRSGAFGLRLWWPRAQTAARVGGGGPVDRPGPPASAARRRLMDALGGVGLAVAVLSLVGDLLSR